MTSTSKAGIQTSDDGSSFIPSSKRADGTTRKEIRVRPGYRPPEDVETYKNRTAEAWKNRGKGGVPGAESDPKPTENEAKSKNAKRREAARRRVASEENDEELSMALKGASLETDDKLKQDWRSSEKLANHDEDDKEQELEQQKKIRNVLKKLKAVRELKAKKNAGEKLSPDQLMKMGKEEEMIRDLNKLGYDGPELGQPDGSSIAAGHDTG
jgi:partner of Y14 and mago